MPKIDTSSKCEVGERGLDITKSLFLTTVLTGFEFERCNAIFVLPIVVASMFQRCGLSNWLYAKEVGGLGMTTLVEPFQEASGLGSK